MPALAPFLHSLYPKLDIARGPDTPAGVYARVVEGRTLYVNTTAVEKTVVIKGKKHGVLSNQTYGTVLRLKPHDVDLLE
jgi:beta-galactosidase